MQSTIVTFIGAGNLAWHLAPALDNTDYSVREVFSRSSSNAEALAGRLYQASVVKTLDFSDSRSGIFIVAVTDDAIEEVVHEIVLPDDAVLVHTSGSRPMEILADAATSNIGVLYPLQTFTKGKKIDFRDIPVLVEGANKETEGVLLAMARAVSRKVRTCTSDDRKALHVAAVFASNFTNHMLAIAKEIVGKRGLDFDLLKPLVVETVNKSLAIGPANAQTGPAHRGDLEVLDQHIEFLSDDERLAEIYRVISQDILDAYKPE